jgi:hypothetical protein
VRLPRPSPELELVESGLGHKLEQLARGGREGLIAVRPDVGPPKAHDQVDVGGPAADAAEPHEAGSDLVVG